MAALLKSAESKDFVGSNPTLSATLVRLTLFGRLGTLCSALSRCIRTLGRSTALTGTIGWLG